mmetsp:Transcript_15038/g.24903  ORF Transcript_15038/g.24903 Transcript_15038/m.24903 type:complete len:389 (-) Transcript_15038:6-1172(-)
MADFTDSSNNNDEERVVVIDNGSGFIKAGFGGDELTPSIVIPTVVGRAKVPGIIVGNEKDYYIGEEAEMLAGMLNCSHPIQHGVIIDWDSMERIWSHVFYNELHVAPDKQRVILTVPPLSPRSNRERIAHIMFDKFNVIGIHLVDQYVLSLYATGKTTGLVINCGYVDCCVAPIYEGYIIHHAIGTLGIGGCDITAYLRRQLLERGYNFSNNAAGVSDQICSDIKEKLAFVALDFDAEMTVCEASEQCRDLDKSYELPDGQQIIVGKERFRCSEILFQPSIIGKTGPGLHQLCENLALTDMKRELFDHVVLCGGSSMIRGMGERLHKEIKRFVPTTMSINISTLSDRNTSAWTGGSLLGGSSCFQSIFVNKYQYEKDGYAAIERRCGA